MSGSAIGSIARIGLIALGNYIAPGWGGVIGECAGKLLCTDDVPPMPDPKVVETVDADR